MAQNATVAIYPQIVNRIPKALISESVSKYNTDYRAKGVRHVDAFYTLLFHQLSGSVSMRDTILGMASCKENGYEQHCGFKALRRSTLSYVLSHRDYRVFEHLYMSLYNLFKPKLQGRLSSERFGRPVFSVDSTSITLCLSIFEWAHYSRTKGAIKLHTMLNNDTLLPEVIVATDGKVGDVTAARDIMKFPSGSIVVMDRGYNDYKLFAQLTEDDVHFITRLKKDAQHTRMTDAIRSVDPEGKWGDYEVCLTSKQAVDSGNCVYRVIQWYDEENDRWFEFITNNFELKPEDVALLYRDRWQIELFFKKVKQNLRLKDFLGTSFNAVMSQVWCAAIAVLLLEVLRLQSKYAWSFSNLAHNLRLNLLSFRKLDDWLNSPASAVIPEEPSPQQDLFSCA